MLGFVLMNYNMGALYNGNDVIGRAHGIFILG